MTSETEDLKPCPFCGGKPHAYANDDGKEMEYGFECTGCDMVCTDLFGEQAEAFTAWNTRTTPSDQTKRIEELEQSLNWIDTIAEVYEQDGQSVSAIAYRTAFHTIRNRARAALKGE